MIQKALAVVVLLCASARLAPAEAADYWVDAQSPATGHGTRQRPFRTIQQAAERAEPGDTVHVLPGIYRERVTPPRGGAPGHPIRYISETRHAAVVKGSDLWSPAWRDEGAGRFSASLEGVHFTDSGYVDGANPYRIPYDWDQSRHSLPPYPYRRVRWTLGQVFVDGEALPEASSPPELSAQSPAWCYDPNANRILVHLGGPSPATRTVELTTRRAVFRPLRKGLGYIEVRGFVFEHCANQFPAQFWRLEANAQSGMVGTRGGHHWVIADNIIRHAKSVGLSFGASRGGRPGDTFDNERPAQAEPGREVTGYHRIENNRFAFNGAIGAMGCNHTGVVFHGNLFVGNNALRNTAYEIGGIKTHQAYGLRIDGNAFLDNDCMGVWLDNTWRNCRVTRNLFAGNRGKSLFVEMDDNGPDTAALVDRNLFLAGRPRLTPGGPGHGPGQRPTQPWTVGLYGHDADGVRIVRNLFAGPGYGLYFRKITDRKGGAAHITARGNLFAADLDTAVCLPIEHPPLVHDNHLDFNLYPSSGSPFAVTTWSQPDGSSDRAGLEQLGERLARDGDTPQPFVDPGRAPVGYRLHLAPWRRIMGGDTHSVAAGLAVRLDRSTWTLELTVPAAVLRVAPPATAGVTTDIRGRPLAAPSPPGPFADLRPGIQTVTVPGPQGLLREGP